MTTHKIAVRASLPPGGKNITPGVQPEQQPVEAAPAAVTEEQSTAIPPEFAAMFGLPPERPAELEFEIVGKRIKMSEPKRVSVSRLVAQILKDTEILDPKILGEEIAQVTSYLYIDSIDGVPTQKPQNSIDRDALEQALGPVAATAVKQQWFLRWRPCDPSEIKIISKR